MKRSKVSNHTFIFYLFLWSVKLLSVKSFSIHSRKVYKPVVRYDANSKFASLIHESQEQQETKGFRELRAIPQEKSEISESSLSKIQINPPYLIAWLAFLSYAFFFTPEPLVGGDNSQKILDAFIANAINPENVNDLFVWVFSLFTFIPIVLASLIMPGARGQTLPATPFLIGASALGYFPLGKFSIGSIVEYNHR